MTSLRFPCVLFKTRPQFNDYRADDMQYGDMTEARL